MNDADRIFWVTKHYRGVQGLRRVPFGAWVIVYGISGDLGVGLHHPLAYAIVLDALLAAAAVAYVALGVFYGRRYGVAKEGPWRSCGRWVFACLWFVAFTQAQRFNGFPHDPGPLWGLLFLAAWLGVVAWRDWPFRKHYVWVAAAICAVSWARPLGVPSVDVLYMPMLGVALAATGIADHRLLVRSLAKAKHSAEGTIRLVSQLS